MKIGVSVMIAALIVVLTMGLVASCNVTTKVSNSGIPTEYTRLEFWNGGGKIREYEDVTMKIEIVSTTKVVGANVYFYKYHVYDKNQGIDEYIIDSEALALVYEE
jgi:hypothetical protein